MPPLPVESGPAVQAKKLPAPPPAAQDEASRLIEEIYKLSQAKTRPQKLALANQLFKAGQSTQYKPEERFVLLRRATDLAVEGGDVTLMLASIRQAAGEFDFDFLAALQRQLARVAQRPMDAQQAKAFFLGVRQAIDEASAAGRDELAQGFLGLARQVAQRKEGKEYRPLIGRFQAEINKVSAHRQELRGAQAALASNPDDPEANRSMGAYYCLAEGDWEHGLACLAKGSDTEVRALATTDVGSPPSASDEQMKRAAQWWEVAQSRHGTEQDMLMVRAGYWYEQAHQGMADGLQKVSVEQRLGDIAKMAALAAEARKPQTALWNGAVLLMSFEADTLQRDGKKVIVHDLSGTGTHGEVTGATLNLNGRAGEALQLDGKGGVVLPTLRNCLAANLKALSISLWIKEAPAGGADGWAYLFNVGGGLGQGVSLVHCRGDQSIRFTMPMDAGGDICRVPGINAAQWRHVAAVWSGSEQRIYIDAELADRVPTQHMMLTNQTLGKEAAALGHPARPGATAKNFQGLMDEVAIFTRELTQRDIYALYHRGLQGTCLSK